MVKIKSLITDVTINMVTVAMLVNVRTHMYLYHYRLRHKLVSPNPC